MSDHFYFHVRTSAEEAERAAAALKKSGEFFLPPERGGLTVFDSSSCNSIEAGEFWATAVAKNIIAVVQPTVQSGRIFVDVDTPAPYEDFTVFDWTTAEARIMQGVVDVNRTLDQMSQEEIDETCERLGNEDFAMIRQLSAHLERLTA